MKKNFLAAAVLLPLALSSCSEAEPSGIRVTASFYPVYIIAENVVGDVPGIDLRSMAQPQTGCLHDYQLTTADMRSLEDTDLFIVNGGGMESFLDNALELFPELDVIDTSAGVTSLEDMIMGIRIMTTGKTPITGCIPKMPSFRPKIYAAP